MLHPLQPEPTLSSWHRVNNALLEFIDGPIKSRRKVWDHNRIRLIKKEKTSYRTTRPAKQPKPLANKKASIVEAFCIKQIRAKCAQIRTKARTAQLHTFTIFARAGIDFNAVALIHKNWHANLETCSNLGWLEHFARSIQVISRSTLVGSSTEIALPS